MGSSTVQDTMYTKLFVGGLPYQTTDVSLKAFFEQFGEVAEAIIITDRSTGNSKGYGFVNMMDKLGAEAACEDPNPIIEGRKANVNLAYLGAKPRSLPGLSTTSVTPVASGVSGVSGAQQFTSAASMPAEMYQQYQYVLTPQGLALWSPMTGYQGVVVNPYTQYYPGMMSSYTTAYQNVASVGQQPDFLQAKTGVPSMYNQYVAAAQIAGNVTGQQLQQPQEEERPQ